MSVRPPFSRYLSAVWDRRDFIWLDARSRAFQSDRDLWLGRLWLILSPILDGLMYGFIFGVILKTSRGIDNFVGYLFIGIVFFGMMQGGLTSGIGLTRSFRGMLGAFDFPAASLVISRSLRLALDSLIPAAVAIVVSLVFQWGTGPWWTLVLVVPLWGLIHFFAVGLTFVTARLTAQLPDLKTFINLASRAWFFLSGVFFSIERFVDQPTLRLVMQENPAYRFLAAVRQVVLYGELPTSYDWVFLITWAFGTASIGFVFFWQGEGKYATVR